MGVRLNVRNFHIMLLVTVAVCLCLGDWHVYSHDASGILQRILYGALTPDFSGTEHLAQAITNTLAFALLGVMGAWLIGFLLALVYHRRAVRILCASVRGVHELFWALIFLQIFGLHPLTGLLAILIPYSGICARVYAELLEETSATPERNLLSADRFSRFVWARVTQAWPHVRAYSGYRMECGLRSSAVLGFIGLPTLGFHLESAFKQGHYSQAFAVLYVFFVLIGTRHWWLRPRLLPFYVLAACVWLPAAPAINTALLWRFISHDIWPQALLAGNLTDALAWVWRIAINEGMPGIGNTLLLSWVALALTLLLGLLQYPWVSRHFVHSRGRWLGHALLVVLRSTPEYVLAYIGLIWLGPSMLPAALALSVHNGAIIAFLTGKASNTLALRADTPGGINRYFWVVLPRMYRTLLAFTLYRFEIILRESAILGILGIHTLGFYIDSAFEDIRFDKALLLIALTAWLNIAAEILARQIRSSLTLKTTPETI
ncbi:MAG TPA: ABC transporter permease [Pseudomonadales bacterium]